MMSTSRWYGDPASPRRDFELDFADDGPPMPVDQRCILFGAAEFIETRSKFPESHSLAAAVADLHDVRFRNVAELNRSGSPGGSCKDGHRAAGGNQQPADHARKGQQATLS